MKAELMSYRASLFSAEHARTHTQSPRPACVSAESWLGAYYGSVHGAESFMLQLLLKAVVI